MVIKPIEIGQLQRDQSIMTSCSEKLMSNPLLTFSKNQLTVVFINNMLTIFSKKAAISVYLIYNMND